MTLRLHSTIIFTLAASACARGGDAAREEQSTESALSAPGGDQCALVDDAAFAGLHAILDDALALEQQDEAANGITGDYATAPGYSRGYIEAAIQMLDDHVDWMHGFASDGDPGTNYVEGYITGELMWQLSEQLQFASHWASISASYHQSEYARSAVESILQAIENANEIHAHGVRCGMDIYFL